MVYEQSSSASKWRKLSNSISLDKYATFGSNNFPLSSMEYTPDGRYGLSIVDGVTYRFRMVNMVTGTIESYCSDEDFGGELLAYYWVSNTEFVLVNFLSPPDAAQLFEQRRYRVCHKEQTVWLTCPPLETEAFDSSHRLQNTAGMPWGRGTAKMVLRGKEFLLLPSKVYFTFVPWDPLVHQVRMSAVLDISASWRNQKYDVEFQIFELDSPFTCGSTLYFTVGLIDPATVNNKLEASLEYIASIDLNNCNMDEDFQVISDDMISVELVKLDQLQGTYSISAKHTVFQQDHYVIIQEKASADPGFYQQKDLDDEPCEVFVIDLKAESVSRTLVDINSNSVLSLYKSSIVAWMDCLNTNDYCIDYKMKIQPIQNKKTLSLQQIAKNALLANPTNSHVPECWLPIYFNSY